MYRTCSPWDEDTRGLAAEGGHLDLLQWARANGCPGFVFTYWQGRSACTTDSMQNICAATSILVCIMVYVL